jgi:hypothetical protein
MIFNEFSKNNNIALEFLVYEDPPKPLLFYKKELSKLGADILIRILKPKIEVISRRRKERNLPHDRDYFDRKKTGAECKDHLQIEVLGSKHIKKEWIIEDSEFSLEDIYKNYFAEFVEK